MRRWNVLAPAAGAALLLAACSGQAQPNITVNNPGSDQSGISVAGTGEVTGVPDTLSVDIGVSVLADTVAEATATAGQKADALIGALIGNGVSREDITTTNYSIYPEYDWRGDQERLLGYRVSNTVRAKIRDVAGAGDVLDSAVAAAGDDARVNGLSFAIEDDAALVRAARQAAWNDAFAKATQLAELSDQALGPVISITETVSRPPAPIFFDDFAPAEDAEFRTAIEPGTSEVVISLEVHFALAR